MKLDFPATQRNKKPILQTLRDYITPDQRVLELASGSGQHAIHFAPRLRVSCWQPSDLDPQNLQSIASYARDSELVSEPLQLDISSAKWPVGRDFDAIFCANLIHISPWSVSLSLFDRARHHLRQSGLIILYGPFFIADVDPARSNLEFDRSLREMDPSYGIRLLQDVDALAKENGFTRLALHYMPANNCTVIYRAVP